jgi:HEAT repeat protein
MTRFTRSFIFALVLLMLFGARALVSDRVWAESFQSVAAVFPAAGLFSPDHKVSTASLSQAPADESASDTEIGPDPTHALKSLLRSDSDVKREIFSLLQNEQYEEAKEKLTMLLDSYPDNEGELRTILRLVRELERERNPEERKRLLEALSGANSMAQELTGFSKDLEELNAKLKVLEHGAPSPTHAEANPDNDLSGADREELEKTVDDSSIQNHTVKQEDHTADSAKSPEKDSAKSAITDSGTVEGEHLRSDLRTTCAGKNLTKRNPASSRNTVACLTLATTAFNVSADQFDATLAALALDAVSRVRISSSHGQGPATSAESALLESVSKTVSSSDDGVAWNGAAALGQIYPISHAALVTLARSERAADRSRAVFAFGLARAETSVGILALALSDDNLTVRNEAVRALRRIGNKTAKETFDSYSAREVPRLAQSLKAAVTARNAVGPNSNSEASLKSIISILNQATSFGEPAAVLATDIAPLLSDTNSQLLIEATDALTALGASATAPQVAKLLESPDSAVSTVAAEALVKFGENSVGPLTEMLNSSDKSIRLRASAVLERLGKPGIAARDRQGEDENL